MLHLPHDTCRDAREPPLCLRQRPREGGSDFGQLHLLDVAAHEQCAVVTTQAIEEPMTTGDRLPRLEVRAHDRTVRQLSGFGQAHPSPRATTPELVLCNAEGDVDDERAERPMVAKLAHAREQAGEDLLGEVLLVRPRAEITPQNAQYDG